MLDRNSKKSLSSKIVLSAIALLVWTGNAFGKAKHYGQLFLDSGAPKSGAQVLVYSGAALATLYSDSEGLAKLANPITTSSDGVYWFYADNGRYATVEQIGGEKRIIDSEVHVLDPSDPHTLTATSEEVALTLTHIDSDEVETSSSIVLRREDGPEIETKGPWRRDTPARVVSPPPAATRFYTIRTCKKMRQETRHGHRAISKMCAYYSRPRLLPPAVGLMGISNMQLRHPGQPALLLFSIML